MIYWVLARSRPRALREIQDPGQKQKNCNFPELGALLGGKSVCPKSFSVKLRNFFRSCVFADRTPRGGKSPNTGFLDPFGLGQPLGTWRNSGPKTEKRSFPELGALLEKKICPPQKFLPEVAHLFYILRFGRVDPHGREIAKYRFSRPF